MCIMRCGSRSLKPAVMSGLHAPPVALVHDGPLGDADGGGGRGEAGPQGMSEVRVAVVYGT